MKKTATLALAMLALSAVAAFAVGPGPFYAKGDYYAGTAGTWNFDSGNEFTTFVGGVWNATVTADQAGTNHQFKVANADWSENYPPNNQRVHATAGDVVHFTFDTNTYADGYLPATNILWSDHYAPAGSTFEIIGGAPETGAWGTGVATDNLGGVWTKTLTIATPGTYEFLFRVTGNWGVCEVGANGGQDGGQNGSYTTAIANQDVKFEFNSNTGRIRTTLVGPTATQSNSWGAIKSLYR